MNFSLHSLFSILAAACAATIVYNLLIWLLNRRPSAARSLQDYAFSPPSASAPDVPIGSPVYKIRLAFAGYGFDVSGREQFSLYLAIAILGLGLAFGAAAFGLLPPLFWLGGPVIAWFAVNGLVNSQWNKMRMALEKEIPSFLMNLSSVIQSLEIALPASQSLFGQCSCRRTGCIHSIDYWLLYLSQLRLIWLLVKNDLIVLTNDIK